MGVTGGFAEESAGSRGRTNAGKPAGQSPQGIAAGIPWRKEMTYADLAEADVSSRCENRSANWRRSAQSVYS
jgi:hypothetical protein